MLKITTVLLCRHILWWTKTVLTEHIAFPVTGLLQNKSQLVFHQLNVLRWSCNCRKCLVCRGSKWSQHSTDNVFSCHYLISSGEKSADNLSGCQENPKLSPLCTSKRNEWVIRFCLMYICQSSPVCLMYVWKLIPVLLIVTITYQAVWTVREKTFN